MLSNPLLWNLVIPDYIFSKKECAVANNWNWIL